MHHRLRPAIALALTVLYLASCGGGSLAEARALGTVEAYRRFLAQQPSAREAAEARKGLDQALFRQARAADRPAGYHRYLAEFPRGHHASAARRRLARLALDRARDVPGLELVLERYPQGPEAQAARQRLAQRLAAAALSVDETAPAAGFLRRFPGHDRAPEVRGHLARLHLPAVPRRAYDLERFVDRFAGTTAAEQATEVLRQLLAGEVEATADTAALAHFEARFADDPRLPQLRRAVETEQSRRALARLDLGRLAELDLERSSAEIGRVQRFCRRRPRSCQRVRDLARAAGPYRPAASLAELSREVFAADILDAWRAIAALAYHPDPRAGRRLVELVGSQQFALAWAAARALSTWVGRLPSGERLRWSAELLRRLSGGTGREANPDDLQRQGLLLLLLGKPRGADLLRRETGYSGRSLVAGYLLLAAAKASTADAQRLTSAVAARLQTLKQTFPSPLDRDSAPTAILAERELFALSRALARLPSGEVGGRGDLLQREVRETLAGWRARIGAAVPDFRVARQISFAQAAQQHQAGRAAALARLGRARDPASRAAHGAICAAPDAPCGAPDGGRGQQR